MRDAYHRVQLAVEHDPTVRYLRFATPLMRAHTEHALASVGRAAASSGGATRPR